MPKQQVNAALDNVHDMLVSQVNALSIELGQTTNQDLAQAIATEMREFTHRIDITQSLLFTASSDKLSNLVDNVKAANNDLTNALANIQAAAAFIKQCTTFLTVVDQAIDLAKLL